MALICYYRSTQTGLWLNSARQAATMAQVRAAATSAVALKAVSGESGVFGTNYLDMASPSVARAPMWVGFQNTPSAQAFAILIRLIPRFTGAPPSYDMVQMVGSNSQGSGRLNFATLGTGAFRLNYSDADGSTSQSISTTSTYTSYVSGTAVDVMVSWDGTTGSNAFSVGINGVSLQTVTAGTALYTLPSQITRTGICVGIGPNSALSNWDLNEFAIYDNAQTVTYTTRVDFLPVTAFDASTYTDPGIANVRSTTTYSFAGSSLTGTAAIPTAGNVRLGTATDNTTGTLAVPTAANVRNGVAVDAGTGNLVVPIPSTVQVGVTYDSNSSVTGTYAATCDYPIVGNVKQGVSYAVGTLTGTYNPLASGVGIGSPHLSEKARILIVNLIKANIVAELSSVRTDRNDPTVTTEPPQQYFIYGEAHTYQCPAVFIVVDSGEFPDENTRTNYVSAVFKVYVSVVVEGQNEKSLTIKCERYQAALFKILHETVVSDSIDNVKIYTRCKRFQFSDLYTHGRKKDNMGDFRKEVAIELEVKHWENPTK